MKMINIDEKFMRFALDEARLAARDGEVPVGAILVKNGEVLVRAHNLREALFDPTAHAEMLALREASQRLLRWRLSDTTLYVTMEPCAMCAGAAISARIARIVYGCRDPKAGACGSVFDVAREPQLNHRVEITGGVLKEASQEIIQKFFEERREKTRH
jgi:tRNA(adenine34) deaminase